MPLKVMDVVDQRLVVVRAVLAGSSAREVAARHVVSKSQVYEWVARYRQGGAEALVPRSRRPALSPGQTTAGLEDAIVAVHKERFGRWGAKKIRATLLEQGHCVPAVSTVHAVLVRRGLVTVRTRARRPPPGQRFEREHSNELWQIDGTQHRLVNGRDFWVVDLVDDHSRFLLAARVGPALTGELAWRTLRGAVDEYGLPQQVLSDNGTQFTGRLLGDGTATVRFERQAVAAGITLRHSRPYHPQTAGKIERQHRTQNEWVADHRPRSLREAQAVLDAYREDYNNTRPHEGIGLIPPARRYQPGTPVQLPDLELDLATQYPPDALLRRVDPRGRFRYSSRTFTVDPRWAGVTVGLLHTARTLHVYYGHAEISTLHIGDLPRNYAQRKINRS